MGLTCLVTVHGIGFQQPPTSDREGYADPLHELLRKELGDRLGDDPERATGGPVYVQSEWNGIPKAGLARLDRSRPLIAPTQNSQSTIAHVALVYSGLQSEAPCVGAALDTLAQACIDFPRYAGPVTAMRDVVGDGLAIFHTQQLSPSLRPRTDLPDRLPGPMSTALHALFTRHAGPGAHTQAHHSWILRTLSDDVADYVCRNELRERVRDFVQEALTRLQDNPDIDRIVFNTHSQGSVLVFDVLARCPADKVTAMATAGSPLRKYVDLFSWGDRVGELGRLATRSDWQWLNFYDEHDPVADPLGAPASWRLGDALPATGVPTLFRIGDVAKPSTATVDCPVEDIRVDNVAHSSGGGLRAHNYWDNAAQVIPRLAGLL